MRGWRRRTATSVRVTEAARAPAERIAAEPPVPRNRWLARRSRTELHLMATSWPFWARPSQLPPDGDWRVWLILAGRGFGKTRAGAEWVRAMAEADPDARIALVAATASEGRAVMVEGESGLMNIGEVRPRWEPSLGRLSWPNGAQAFLYSAAEPESLRGPQHHLAWADEIAKWPQGRAVWDNLMLGLRLGERPQAVATTTPRPVPLLHALLRAGDVATTRGATTANRAHLPPAFLRAIRDSYGGTRLGRQELDGELIAELEGALWSRELIERCRVRAAPEPARVVVAVDPPAGAGLASDACGIVAVAKGHDGLGYVLEDASVAGLGPDGWARAVAAAAGRHKADRVVAEANNGGAMVESVLRAADAALPVKLVHAAQGKVARAEPIMLLYERGQVFHVGAFPALEDEMAGLVTGGGYHGPGRSPDRADALVWALAELMLTPRARPAMRRL